MVVSLVINDAEKFELSTLTIEQLRAGVRHLGQISGFQALSERQFEPDSPTATRHTATEGSFLSSEGSTEANEGEREGDPGDLALPEG